MTIQKIGSDIIASLAPKGQRASGPKADEKGDKPARAPRQDQVGFSPEGLALAEQSLSVEGGLAPARVTQIHQRIADGFYDSPEVAGEVASRLVESGDFDHLS
jgi:hypothetical protein